MALTRLLVTQQLLLIGSNLTVARCAWRSYSCWRVSFPVRRHSSGSDRDSWAEWGQQRQQQLGCGRRWESAGGEVVLLQHGEWRLDPHAAVREPLVASTGDLWRHLWLEEGIAAVCAGPWSTVPHLQNRECLKWSSLKWSVVFYLSEGSFHIVANTSLKAKCVSHSKFRDHSRKFVKIPSGFLLTVLDLSTADKPSCSNFISFTVLLAWPLKCHPFQGKGMHKISERDLSSIVPSAITFEVHKNVDLSR